MLGGFAVLVVPGGEAWGNLFDVDRLVVLDREVISDKSCFAWRA